MGKGCCRVSRSSQGSAILDVHPTSASFTHSNDLATSSSLSLPWFFEENDQFPSMMVNSSSSLFSRGKQSALTTHNWGLDLCGDVPCELPREVVRDAIAMIITSRN